MLRSSKGGTSSSVRWHASARGSGNTPGDDAKPMHGFALSLNYPDANEARRVFDALSQGGSVMMPLEKAPWGDTFGMCTDRFGIQWLVNIAGKTS